MLAMDESIQPVTNDLPDEHSQIEEAGVLIEKLIVTITNLGESKAVDPHDETISKEERWHSIYQSHHHAGITFRHQSGHRCKGDGGTSGREITEGLYGLRERLAEYSKWGLILRQSNTFGIMAFQ